MRKVLRGGLMLRCQKWRIEYVAQVNDCGAAGSLPAHAILSLLRKICTNYPPGVKGQTDPQARKNIAGLEKVQMS